MVHMCEMLASLKCEQRFRVFYWDSQWCEIESLRMEHARAEYAYGAIGLWLLYMSSPGMVESDVREALGNVVSVTVEVANE